ncbi:MULTISPECIES: HAD family hydrolase [unclassified Paenibacillus]|uniref:D-glycero-alpha-D-manno-heptose-1,7-bisphosphate 7-phosphatase n=1 Tax=unclassified Paenibacillus TaxID=185978 RepID=UPI00095663D2|nr:MULTISPECIES: HAD family hydrolase [unclassified Paenibacillus]ASS68036.1 HAD family hydrolase [Paenibacillus sp. RUD330]SIR40876.1 D-glycero-D-manno-heptose 1,7-bisphosphate phosphatase [Paenibacillus sp. RU4X]SIR51032.1 D-glycero-D-manno-heptose 1,7-bisphosphate phosphatase [Paenibacillus sp. RU4T]
MKSAKAVFLDRDGVVNEMNTARVRQVNGPDDVHLLPGTAEAIRGLAEAGYRVYVVTNQGGVGLGYMSLADLKAVHERLEELLAGKGARLDGIAFCPHKPDSGCACRKPRPGMLLELAKRHRLSLGESYMIGDRESDIAAGRAAGTRTIRVGGAAGRRKGKDGGSREGAGSARRIQKHGTKPSPADWNVSSLLEAAVLIVQRLAEERRLP